VGGAPGMQCGKTHEARCGRPSAERREVPKGHHGDCPRHVPIEQAWSELEEPARIGSDECERAGGPKGRPAVRVGARTAFTAPYPSGR
jgi:hypothetical protein